MLKRKITIADIRLTSLAKKYIGRVLANNRLTYGPLTEVFEKKIAKKISRRYALFVNSGTSGLTVAIQAMKELYHWQDKDEILVPAVTFIATSNVVLHTNLRPVFVDVEPDYYCIDAAKIEKKISRKTRAILPVNLFGQSADLKTITAIAKKHHLKIIEDSCESMFVKYAGQPVGSLSDVSVFSTYATHILTTGVGGLITTDNKKLFEVMETLIFHGRDNIYLNIDDDDNLDDESKLKQIVSRRFLYHRLGYNFRLTEMEAAIGLAQLTKIDDFVKKRQAIARQISKTLSPFKNHLQLPKIRAGAEHGFMLYPIVITNPSIKKMSLLIHLEQNGVETREFMPLLSQPIYKKIFGDIEKDYPVAQFLVKNGFIIGCHPYLKKADIDYLGKVFNSFFHHG